MFLNITVLPPFSWKYLLKIYILRIKPKAMAVYFAIMWWCSWKKRKKSLCTRECRLMILEQRKTESFEEQLGKFFDRRKELKAWTGKSIYFFYSSEPEIVLADKSMYPVIESWPGNVELVTEGFYSLNTSKIFPKDIKNKTNGIGTVWDQKVWDKGTGLATVRALDACCEIAVIDGSEKIDIG